MALFLKPDDAPRPLGVFLTKRLIRIGIAASSVLFFITLLLWHFTDLGRLPPLGFPGSPRVYPFPTFSDYYPVSVDPEGKTKEELCASFPRHLLDLVQPVLKMGHSEDRAKVDAQFDTVSACFRPDQLLVFSDLDETVHGHPAVDVLANLPPRYYDEAYNPDIHHYLLQKELSANGTLGDNGAAHGINGWIIDKFKFLPQMERAWLLKPERPFYFFYESDTYVIWDNVFRFLSTFDPDSEIYMGSPSTGMYDRRRGIKTFFANGGPGFVLSRAAMRRLLHRASTPHGQFSQPSLAQRWLSVLKVDCCGDSITGWALWNAGVAVQGYWPMFNPHGLHGIPFGDSYWCHPVLTLHKTMPDDMRALWRWEFAHRSPLRPLLYADLFAFHHPVSPAARESWDNGEWDAWSPGSDAEIDSFESCEAACRDHEDCVQWNWRGRDEKRCVLSRSVRYGNARGEERSVDAGGKENLVDFTSGWVEERVQRLRDRVCKSPEWVGPSITRIF